MPEGPELHLSSLFVNKVCKNTIFSGKVVKSEVSKNAEIPWDCPAYTVHSASRGKEVKLTLTAIKQETPQNGTHRDRPAILDIVVRFGMSGCFKFDKVGEQRKHAHLNLYTADGQSVLSFVDVRRFGRWDVAGDWSADRGPCVILEYQAFRENVLRNLKNSAFDKPICEVLLNQKFFNGIGNYLRAEVLYRLGIKPFERARDVLQPLVPSSDLDVKEVKVKCEKQEPDILTLCNKLPLEVIKLGGTTYTLESDEKDYSAFSAWLQCYYCPDMKNMVDHNGRTIWFTGQPGPLAPSGMKSKKRKSKTKLNKEDAKSEDVDVEEEQRTKRKRDSMQGHTKVSRKSILKEKNSARTQACDGKNTNTSRKSKRVTATEDKDVKNTRHTRTLNKEIVVKTEQAIAPRRSTRSRETLVVNPTVTTKTPRNVRASKRKTVTNKKVKVESTASKKTPVSAKSRKAKK